MSEEREIIGIDLDQALLTCDSRIYRYLNKLNFNKNKNCKHFEIKEETYKLGNINKIFKLFNPDSYVAFPDAIETINNLSQNGNLIYFISNRPKIKPIIKMTYQWFKLNNVKYDMIILGCQNKLRFAKENNVKYFIDNNIKICKDIALNSEIKSIYYNSENNMDLSTNGIISKTTWKEIEEYFFEENESF